jgi:hypothetical protein
MDIIIQNLSMKLEFYDSRFRLQNRKEIRSGKLRYRYVVGEKKGVAQEDKENYPDNNQKRAASKSSFQEIRVLSQYDILSDIFLVPSLDPLTVEKSSSNLTLLFNTYKVKLILEGESNKLAMLFDIIQRKEEIAATKAIQQPTKDTCPLRSDSLSSSRSHSSPLHTKKETKSNFYGIKEKMKFSDLEKDKTGFTPELKRIYNRESEINLNEEQNDYSENIYSTFARDLPIPPSQRMMNHRPTISSKSVPVALPPPPPTSQVQSQPSIVRNLNQETTFQKTIELSEEQDLILQKAVAGESFFLTGAGGCGKSFLLKKMIEQLLAKYKHSPDSVYVLAPTGLAAFAVGGMTIHQYLTIPVIDFDDVANAANNQSIITKTKEKKFIIQRCQQTRVIIIDEISMLDPRLFELLNGILQQTRKSTQSFGGVQLVVSGDFFQLPPVRVSKQANLSSLISSSSGPERRYCFQSPLWTRLFSGHSYELKTIHRQSNDLEYLSLLNHLRHGQLSAEELKKLNDCYNKNLISMNDIVPTQIFTHK